MKQKAAEHLLFAQRLKELRNEAHITQFGLAEKLCIDKTSISKYEKSGMAPSISMLIAIADYFSVTTDYLLGRTELRVSAKEAIQATYQDSDIYAIIKARNDMSKRERRKMMKILWVCFDEYFDDPDSNIRRCPYCNAKLFN